MLKQCTMQIQWYPLRSMRNAMNDIIVFETLCFRPSTRKREASVFKALHLKDVFSVTVLPKKGGR